MVQDEAWYVSAFAGGYMDLYPHRDLTSARKEVRHLVQSGLQGRVLDLCCGFGRHSLALLDEGIDVVGIDLSQNLLDASGSLEGSAALRGRLLRADVRWVPLQSQSFDAVVNLFSSFGYFTQEQDQQVLDEMARLTRLGGRVVMDMMNPARIREGLVAKSVRTQGELTIREERALEDGARRVTKQVTVLAPGGESRTWREDVRMYELEELEPMFEARGLLLQRAEGGFDGSPLSPQSERQLLTLRRG